MKKFLLTISVPMFLFACKSQKDINQVDKELAPLDNSLLYNNSKLTDVGKVADDPDAEEVTEVSAPRPQVKVRREVVYVQVPAPAPVPLPAPTPIPQATPAPVETTTAGSVPSAEPKNAGNQQSDETGTIETETKKKGWSDAAKGAAIGGVGGAVAGAVINKKSRGTGAVVGGVVGAVGGYILGRKSDKKTGRVEYSMK